MRTIVAACALALVGCGFPEVPPLQEKLDVSDLEPVPGPPAGEAAPAAGRPVSGAGRLVSSGTSNLAVNLEGEYVQLQVGPSTVVQIGASGAAPRALQPGSDVRVQYVPGRSNLAVRIEADPARLGWRRGAGAAPAR